MSARARKRSGGVVPTRRRRDGCRSSRSFRPPPPQCRQPRADALRRGEGGSRGQSADGGCSAASTSTRSTADSDCAGRLSSSVKTSTSHRSPSASGPPAATWPVAPSPSRIARSAGSVAGSSARDLVRRPPQRVPGQGEVGQRERRPRPRGRSSSGAGPGSSVERELHGRDGIGPARGQRQPPADGVELVRHEVRHQPQPRSGPARRGLVQRPQRRLDQVPPSSGATAAPEHPSVAPALPVGRVQRNRSVRRAGRVRRQRDCASESAWPGTARRRPAGTAAPPSRSVRSRRSSLTTPIDTPSDRSSQPRAQQLLGHGNHLVRVDASIAAMQNSSPPRRAVTRRPGSERRRAAPCRANATSSPVTGVVALVVVDPLEPVEVRDDQADGGAAFSPLRHRVVQPVVQRAPVGQAGERVGLGEPVDPTQVLHGLQGRPHLRGDRGAPVEVGVGERRLVGPAGEEQLAPPGAPRAGSGH